MNPRALEKELLGLERQFWQAMKDRDVDAALRLTDDPCIVTGHQGVARIDKKQFRKMMEAGQWTLHDFSFSDTKLSKLSEEVAVLAYKVHEDLTVEGKKMSLEAADSSTWVRRDGQWVCAVHTEALTGDPFGRDRVKKANGAAKSAKLAKKSASAKKAAGAKKASTAKKASGATRA